MVCDSALKYCSPKESGGKRKNWKLCRKWQRGPLTASSTMEPKRFQFSPNDCTACQNAFNPAKLKNILVLNREFLIITNPYRKCSFSKTMISILPQINANLTPVNSVLFCDMFAFDVWQANDTCITHASGISITWMNELSFSQTKLFRKNPHCQLLFKMVSISLPLWIWETIWSDNPNCWFVQRE